MKTVFFGDDHALVSDSEDALQIYIYIYIHWRHLPPNMDLKFQKEQRQQWLLKEESQ